MSKYQKFEIKTLKRSQIGLADYNPRTITEHAGKELRKKMRTVGLLAPLIFNKRTGTLLSGHQRITQLDTLEGYAKGHDYDIVVSVVDLDAKAEKEMNIFLNNPSAQGEYDMEALKDMMNSGEFDVGELGFEESDLQILFDDLDITGQLEDFMKPSEAKQGLQEIKDMRKQAAERMKQNNDADFYFIVVCKTSEQKQKLMAHFSAEETEQFVRASSVISSLADPMPFYE